MERFSQYRGVMKAHGKLEGSYIFPYRSFKKAIRDWIQLLFESSPALGVMRKNVLIVDGQVKSGKTTLCEFLLPLILEEIHASNASPDRFRNKGFQYVYVELNSLSGVKTLNEKWKHKGGDKEENS